MSIKPPGNSLEPQGGLHSSASQTSTHGPTLEQLVKIQIWVQQQCGFASPHMLGMLLSVVGTLSSKALQGVDWAVS